MVGESDRPTHKEFVPMGSRPLAALASVVLAVLGFVFLIPDCAFACTCVLAEGSQKEIVKDALADSEAVFSGEVVKSTGLRGQAGTQQTSKRTPSGSPNLGKGQKEVCWR
jgi:hypothetical protein